MGIRRIELLRYFAIFLLAAGLLAACQSAATLEPAAVAETTTTPVATAPVTPAAAPPTFTPAPTLPPPPTATPIAVVEQATATPVPATPSSTPESEPEPTPAAEESAEIATVEPLCRTLDQIDGTPRNRDLAPGPWPRGGAWDSEVYAGNGGGYSMIHLGFDVEGNDLYLEEILDILDKYNVKTTMFVLGSWAAFQPYWLEEFVARGHELANHSWTHGRMGEMEPDAVATELTMTEELVQTITGQSTKPWLRPPYGSRSPESVQAAFDNGYTTVVWTSSTDDWRVEYGVEEMCNALMEGAYPGSILYTHNHRPEIPEVIDRFIADMIDQGYTFVPLSVILSDNPAQFVR